MRRGFGVFLVLIGLASATLQFTVRDSIDLLAPLFYALPLPIGAGALFLGGLFIGQRLGTTLATAGLLVGGLWVVRDYGVARPVEGEWKFATWNLQGPRHPFEPLVEFVKRERPDFVAIIEAETMLPGDVAYYEARLRGYRAVPLGGHRAALVRGNYGSVRTEHLGGRSHLAALRVQVGGAWLRVFVVDLDANPFRSRESALAHVARRAGEEERTVVLGDFNTPLQSVHLAPLRARFQSATETRHRGFRETWPYAFPLLSLDQVWLSRDLEVRFSTRRLTLASDHTPVIVTFSPR